MDQIFALLEEKSVASVEDLQDEAANHDYAFSFLQDLALGDYHRLEGYLYPDTYEFTTPRNPCMSSTRCWSALTSSLPTQCARRWPTAAVPSTRSSLLHP